MKCSLRSVYNRYIRGSENIKYIIRTSDRINFKKCRRAWDFQSKIRQFLEPKALRTPLDFGTAIHKAEEVYYDPLLWNSDPESRKALIELAIVKFHQLTDEQAADYKTRNGLLELGEELRIQFKEQHALGEGMLRHYYNWSIPRDTFVQPLYTEVEFEVPILAPTDFSITTLPSDFDINSKRELSKWNNDVGAWMPVMYQGRIDLIIQDKHGIWIVDHKTAARLGDLWFLELDEQMKSYAWAIKYALGIEVKGLLYQELYKGYPEEPTKLKTVRKGCSYSTSKSADTTFEIADPFLRANDPTAYLAGFYDEYLRYLKEAGKDWFRRERVVYSKIELERLGDQIFYEALDMLNDPFIYPNPSRADYGGCKWCDHRTLCVATNEGSDTKWIKDTLYINKKAV